MILGIDVDGVLADFTGHWPAVYERWFGKPVDPKLISTWSGIGEVFGPDSEDAFWRWVDSVPQFWETMPMIPGAAGGLYHLHRDGHVIKLITNRHEKARNATRAWTQRVLPNFGKDWELHHVKGDKAVIDCQIYVEDNPKNILSLRKKQHRVIRFIQPWNQLVDGDFGWMAGSWDGVLSIVRRHQSELDTGIPAQLQITEVTK